MSTEAASAIAVLFFFAGLCLGLWYARHVRTLDDPEEKFERKQSVVPGESPPGTVQPPASVGPEDKPVPFLLDRSSRDPSKGSNGGGKT